MKVEKMVSITKSGSAGTALAGQTTFRIFLINIMTNLMTPFSTVVLKTPRRETGTTTTPQATAALESLGRWLKSEGYRFVCPTPATHARVNLRTAGRKASSIEDIFGWNRMFDPVVLAVPALEMLREAKAVEEVDGMLRSQVRYASIDTRLFVHSAFPTTAQDAVFFGPDTYRFVNFVTQALHEYWPYPVRSLADIGCGSGAGAICAVDQLGGHSECEVILSDINPQALCFAVTNLALNDLKEATCVLGDSLTPIRRPLDLIISNPPYLVDGQHRAYRHGGNNSGVEIATRFLRDALPRLAPGGRLMLYTGTPIINGTDLFRQASLPLLESAECTARYFEIDPDVFGEELERPEYAAADRIAVVGLVAYRAGRLA